MDTSANRQCIAFTGTELVARGDLVDVACAAKASDDPSVLVLDAATSEPVELDLRGTVDDVAARYASSAASSTDIAAAAVSDAAARDTAPATAAPSSA
jgi:uncharacterized protein